MSWIGRFGNRPNSILTSGELYAMAALAQKMGRHCLLCGGETAGILHCKDCGRTWRMCDKHRPGVAEVEQVKKLHAMICVPVAAKATASEAGEPSVETLDLKGTEEELAERCQRELDAVVDVLAGSGIDPATAKRAAHHAVKAAAYSGARHARGAFDESERLDREEREKVLKLVRAMASDAEAILSLPEPARGPGAIAALEQLAEMVKAKLG